MNAISNDFVQRLMKNAKKLSSSLGKKGIKAIRLYDMDIPNAPLIVELFEGESEKYRYAVIWAKWQKIDDDNKRKELLSAAKEYLKNEWKAREVIVKERKVLSHKSDGQYQKSYESKQLVVQEGPLSFLLELKTFIDTGLFLDHRPLRQKLMETCAGKKVLNLFSYTCSLGVAAAKGGALTTNVDLSYNYLDWGKKNYQLNGQELDQHQFIRNDVKEFLLADRKKYDIILLDPPTYSVSKSAETFDIKEEHPALIEMCLKKLKPAGLLYFSTNATQFKLDKEIEARYHPRNISAQSIPVDFHQKKIHQLYLFTV